MKAEVIGDGLLAKAFKKKEFEGDILFFCSGVSNSHETKQSEFDRERDLVKKLGRKHSNSIVVYFSSVMAGDYDSPYYNHKKNIEGVVKKTFKKNLILRLPQVVGLSANNTLFPSFIRKICNNEELQIQENATRTLIDVDDVARISIKLIEANIVCKTINICPVASIRAVDLLKMIAESLNKPLNYTLVEGGVDQKCSANDLHAYIEDDYIFCDVYLNNLVEKYAQSVMKLVTGSVQHFNDT